MTLLAPQPITSRGEPPMNAPALERQSQGNALAKFGVRCGANLISTQPMRSI